MVITEENKDFYAEDSWIFYCEGFKDGDDGKKSRYAENDGQYYFNKEYIKSYISGYREGKKQRE